MNVEYRGCITYPLEGHETHVEVWIEDQTACVWFIKLAHMYIIYKEVLVTPAIDQRFHPFNSQAMQQNPSIHPNQPFGYVKTRNK